jgi:hypothetical protein
MLAGPVALTPVMFVTEAARPRWRRLTVVRLRARLALRGEAALDEEDERGEVGES